MFQGSYLIIGGVGALGLEFGRWLAERGAKHIVLTSRTGLPDRREWPRLRETVEFRDPIALVDAIESSGATVDIVRLDAADAGATKALVEGLPDLRGVIFAAGTSISCSVQEIESEDFREVIQPKLHGGWAIHEATRHRPLDFVVFFSSAASVWGSRNAVAYAAANQFLDALAFYRQAQGLPATTVNWGRLSVRGMLGELEERVLSSIGMRSVNVDTGYAILDRLVRDGVAQAVVADVDWPTFLPLYRMRDRSRRFEWIDPGTRKADQSQMISQALPRVSLPRSMSATQRYELVLENLCADAAAVLCFKSPADVNCKAGLFELGMDSLTAIEFKTRVEQRFAVSVPATALFKYSNLEALAAYLANGDRPHAGDGSDADIAPASTGDLLGRIQRLDEESVDQLLSQWKMRANSVGAPSHD